MACSERLAARCQFAAPVVPGSAVCDNAWPWSSSSLADALCFADGHLDVVVLAPMHLHKHIHAHALSKLVVFAEALCSLSTIRAIRLRTIYRIAFSAERRVREAIRAGGLGER
jgi:hypothetical protein